MTKKPYYEAFNQRSNNRLEKVVQDAVAKGWDEERVRHELNKLANSRTYKDGGVSDTACREAVLCAIERHRAAKHREELEDVYRGLGS